MGIAHSCSLMCNSKRTTKKKMCKLCLRKHQALIDVVIFSFSCSTQMSTKFILLINVKMPPIVVIFTFISRINTILTFISRINTTSIVWFTKIGSILPLAKTSSLFKTGPVK